MKALRLVATAAAMAVGGLAAFYRTRLQTAASVREIARGDDGYGLYAVDISYDYDIDRIVGRQYNDAQEYLEAVVAEALPLVPVRIEIPSFGCSALQLQTREGVWLTGRNYDFGRNTSALLVHCKPKDGYESISFAALDNVGVKDPTTSIAKRLACLAMPFACMDGMNSKGVTVSVLTLDSEPTVQRTGKPTLTTSLVMRLVLDRAATTDEAVELLGRYDMLAIMGRDYHFFISDASGKSVAVEYDCDTPERTMTVTPTDIITNFYVMYGQDVVVSEAGAKAVLNEHGAQNGHGLDRYERILDILCREDGDYTPRTAWDCLRESSQLPDPNVITSNTQWSVMYDHEQLTAEFVQRRRWSEVHRFGLDASCEGQGS